MKGPDGAQTLNTSLGLHVPNSLSDKEKIFQLNQAIAQQALTITGHVTVPKIRTFR